MRIRTRNDQRSACSRLGIVVESMGETALSSPRPYGWRRSVRRGSPRRQRGIAPHSEPTPSNIRRRTVERRPPSDPRRRHRSPGCHAGNGGQGGRTRHQGLACTVVAACRLAALCRPDLLHLLEQPTGAGDAGVCQEAGLLGHAEDRRGVRYAARRPVKGSEETGIAGWGSHHPLKVGCRPPTTDRARVISLLLAGTGPRPGPLHRRRRGSIAKATASGSPPRAISPRMPPSPMSRRPTACGGIDGGSPGIRDR